MRYGCCVLGILPIIAFSDDIGAPRTGTEEILAGLDDSRLAKSERDLLDECLIAQRQLRSEYQSLRAVVRDKTWRLPKSEAADWESSILRLDRSLEVSRLGTDNYLVIGSRLSADGRTSAGVFLINHNKGWNLKLDPTARKYFITTHGTNRFTAEHNRYEEWWVNAATSFYYRSVGLSFASSRGTFVAGVGELTDEEGERLIAIRLTHPRSPKIPEALIVAPTASLFEFYRDRACALRKATTFGYVFDTPTTYKQDRIVQRCDYEPFQDDETPRLTKVVLEESHRKAVDRELSDDRDWTLFQRQQVNFTSLSLDAPDSVEFEIERFIPPSASSVSSRRPMITWFFFGNGILLLLVWFFLRQRQRDAVDTPQQVHD